MFRFLSCLFFQLLFSLALTAPLSAVVPTQHQRFAAQNEVVWTTDYHSALEQARLENKALFLFFTGSDWCSWCVRLEKEVLSQPQFAEELSPYFIFVKLDYPRKASLSSQEIEQNKGLQRQYGITGYPTVVIVNAQEKVLDRTGYVQGGPAQFNPVVLRNVRK